MSTLRFLTGLALVLCLTAACGGGDGGGGSNGQSGQQANRPEAPGAPGGGGYGNHGGSSGGNGGKVAPVSPIRVPHITQAGLLLGPPHNIRGQIERDIERQCGGTLCIRLVEEPRDTEMTKCQFAGLEPEPDTELRDPDAVITILTGTQECGGETGETESPPTETPTTEPVVTPS